MKTKEHDVKTQNATFVHSRWRFHASVYLASLLCLAALGCLAPSRTLAQTVGEKASAAANETGKEIQDAGKTVEGKLEQLWQRIDEARLKNRTPDEIVGWLIMGLLVGGILARATDLRRWSAFAFGLIGAFLGGMVAHVTELDLGLGPVLIRYEDLLISLVGGVLILLAARRFMSRKQKPNTILLLAAGALALAGCSSTPTKVNTGPIRAQSFSFVRTPDKPAPAYANNEQAVHALIQEDITKNLAQRGVSHVAAGGDVTVAYLVITGNNASASSISDYYGYGDDAFALLDKAHTAYSSSKNPNYFEAGTLVIDIVDGKTFKLLKRGNATRPILQNLSADDRAARIQEVVDEILRDLQIAK